MTQSILFLARVFVACGLAVASMGCADPVADQRKTDLGPEDPNIPPGPSHRAGQPCLVCHDGSTALEFSVAGTVYVAPVLPDDPANPPDPDAPVKQPLNEGVITITDTNGSSFWTQANCAGNFFVLPTDYVPVYPYTVAVSYDATYTPMVSVVHREGSCGSCHKYPLGKGSPGPVFLTNSSPYPTVKVCK